MRGPSASLKTFVALELVYVLLLSLTRISNTSALKGVANGYAVGALLLTAFIIVIKRSSALSSLDRLVLITAIFLGFVNYFVNYDVSNPLETLKIVSIFVFYFAGKACSDGFFSHKPSKLSISLFILVPLLVAIPDLGRISGQLNIGDEQTIGFFANRNNAVLFFVTASILLILRNVSYVLVLFYSAVLALAFNTLGALAALATTVALIHINSRSAKVVLIVGASLALILFFGSNLAVVQRIITVYQGAESVIQSAGSLGGLGKMDYGEISQIAGTSDISFIFRLKHWLNIFYIYLDGSFINQIFGYGVGASVAFSDMRLVPHNDYVRFLFELGPALLLCFLFMNFQILKKIGRRNILHPFAFIMLYCITDNIINNFLVMSFSYFIAGALVKKYSRPKPKSEAPESLIYSH